MTDTADFELPHFELPTLYSKDVKGKIREWEVWVETDPTEDSILYRRHGLRDMKKIVEKRIIKVGKNLGRKNETTHFHQACNEARSMWNKQKDRGYSENEDPETPIGPMLAQTWNGKKDVTPCFVQPKLDGVRLLVGCQNGEIILMSRMGKRINFLPHIEKACEGMHDGEWLDGECFSDVLTFEEISGIFRTQKIHPKASELHFHVFDMYHAKMPDIDFEHRLDLLKKLNMKEPLHLVPTLRAHSTHELLDFHDRFVKEGHEGLIIRLTNSPYAIKKRSKGLLKYKHMQTEEFTIIGAEEADGRDKGSVVWVCVTPDQNEFTVRPKGTLQQRKEYWKNYKDYMGMPLTVQFQGFTEKGTPRFPVGLTIRDYE